MEKWLKIAALVIPAILGAFGYAQYYDSFCGKDVEVKAEAPAE